MATTTYVPIATQNGTGTSTLTFNTISGSYTDLVLVANIKASGNTNLLLQFNGDTTSGLYSRTVLTGDGASATSSRDTAQNNITITANGIASTGYSTHIVNIMNYSNATYKTILARSSNSGFGTDAIVGLWRNTNAITSITISAGRNFDTTSTFTLYGIANADTGALATGGIITYDSTYYYHTFGSSGTFTPKQSLTADVLVVAGGGGGGSSAAAGGGGSGGIIYASSYSLSATGYSITVGAGGAGDSGNGNNSTAGGNSQFGSLTAAVGGGRGVGDDGRAAGNGGSGGGAGIGGGLNGGTGGTTTQGTGAGVTAYYGNNGGNGNGSGSGSSRRYNGGGGGGTGAVGANATGSDGGNGGNGISTYSSWSSATGTGLAGYYGGGGGGSSNGESNFGSPGKGGLGGGGLGGTTAAGFPAVINSGSGGGGGGIYSAVYKAGGAGGSGVVIIRYPKA